MGLSRGYRITCDECGREHWAEYYPTPHAARREAKRTGWVRRQVGENIFGAVRHDICPQCAAANEAIEQESQP